MAPPFWTKAWPFEIPSELKGRGNRWKGRERRIKEGAGGKATSGAQRVKQRPLCLVQQNLHTTPLRQVVRSATGEAENPAFGATESPYNTLETSVVDNMWRKANLDGITTAYLCCLW
ncbi:hypothetical protein IV203_006145 [Nitzschia inconspicua]|uniref:Uncharacterized protein n=1 Tax=Nitzschia inconspicua TaxID=303405 RepID=A0A9K3KPK0_9STRA|nr:hypothetical protein IV203_006145 [Nitzschia inconspicua]